ncbi:hypothetical protein EJ110_NYTH44936, partial [Nymphaea thermarum]
MNKHRKHQEETENPSSLLASMAFLTLLLFYCSSLLHVTVEAKAYQNITLGSSLSSLNNTAAWISPSGEFSFGFSRVGDNLYVGVRYEKIPEKTLVWTANRDKPAPPGSTVVLNNNGVLVINDAKGVLFSTIGASSDGSVITSAAMLDTGNLVLTYKLLAIAAIHRPRHASIQPATRIMANLAKRQLTSLDRTQSIKASLDRTQSIKASKRLREIKTIT